MRRGEEEGGGRGGGEGGEGERRGEGGEGREGGKEERGREGSKEEEERGGEKWEGYKNGGKGREGEGRVRRTAKVSLISKYPSSIPYCSCCRTTCYYNRQNICP